MAYVVDKLVYALELDTRKFDQNSKKAEQSVNRLAGSIRGTLLKAVAAVGAGFSAWKLANIAKDATLVAARTQVLKTVLEQVGQVSGYSADELERHERAIKALGITTQASRQLMVRFMQSQLDVADAAKVARAAQDLAVISGQNSSEAAETLTEAISAQRPILLKQFGIVKDLNEVYKDQAALLGKSVQDLTQLEKKQAFLNVILGEAARVSGSYEAAMNDVGKQLTSMPRYIEEFQNALGSAFLPVLEKAVATASSFLKEGRKILLELFDPTELVKEKLGQLDAGIGASLPKIDSLTTRYTELSTKTNKTSAEHEELRQVIREIGQEVPGAVTQWDSYNQAMAINLQTLQDIVTTYENYKESLELDLLVDAEKKHKELTEKLAEETEKAKEYQRILAEIANKSYLGDVNMTDILGTVGYSEYVDAGEAAEEYSDKLKFARAEVGRLTKQLDKLNEALDRYAETGSTRGFQLAELPSYPQSLIEEHEKELANERRYGEELIELRRELGLMGNREYLRVLEERLDQAEQYSGEWFKIWREASQLAYQEALTFAQGLPPLPSNVQQQQESLFADPYAVGEEWKRQAEDIWGDFETRGMSAVEEIDDSMQDMIQAIYPAANFVFGRISQELQSLMNNVMASISGFAQGGAAGISAGIANALSGVMSLFSDSSDRLVLSQRELTEAVERNSDALLRGTTNELDDQLQSLRAFINQMNEGFEGPIDYLVALEKLRQEGFDIPKNLSGEQLREFVEGLLAELEGGLGFYEDILGARSFEDMLRTLGVTGGYKPGEGFTLEGLGFDEATRAIEYWAEIFDLSTEQQLELYERLKRTLEQTGDYSYEELLRINEIIDRLRDSLEEVSGDTQTFRSVTTITESQANLMLGQLNTLAEINRIGNRTLESILSVLSTGTAGAGGRLSTIINNYYMTGGGTRDLRPSRLGATESQLITETQARGRSVFA